ncbi:AHH domain-containing protein [Microbulbifer spongiae]|uniref:AHH domain-containing protein n=1 Tax=Microbulbifer spongiae TaxID=2944933 RepID=A0ABY9EI82_9GAMM|nr:AHH domain-containing protein [Microbulbifer sp. MI-G]WKD50706.1 AHH domain-containing protein [Microbulbifer sp. MI-G]
MFPNHHAHHLIPPAVGKNHPVFKKIGIDLDDEENGILLSATKGERVSALSKHVGSHNEFISFVTDKLDSLNIGAHWVSAFIIIAAESSFLTSH